MSSTPAPNPAEATAADPATCNHDAPDLRFARGRAIGTCRFCSLRMNAPVGAGWGVGRQYEDSSAVPVAPTFFAALRGLADQSDALRQRFHRLLVVAGTDPEAADAACEAIDTALAAARAALSTDPRYD